MNNEDQRSVRAYLGALSLAGLVAVAPVLAGAQESPPAKEDWPSPVPDRQWFGQVLFDFLEYRAGEDEDTFTWEVEAWYGGDYHRLWIDTEGEQVVSGGEGGEIENVDVFYSRLIAPFWDLQAGASYQRQYGPGPDRDRFSGVLALQGLAPYWFEVDTKLRVSEDGDVSVSLEAEYELLLTQRLILQPRFETEVAAQEVEAFGVGEGFNVVELGLRLRYEIRREFAPYIGVSWTRRLGDTADLAREEGEQVDDLMFVAGIRAWF